jgi:hypothetical protein
MRPGSLTHPYKDPQRHAGAHWQIGYTRMRIGEPRAT